MAERIDHDVRKRGEPDPSRILSSNLDGMSDRAVAVLLAEFIGDLSEDLWAASWLEGIEHETWTWAEERSRVITGAEWAALDACKKRLRGAWVCWPRDPSGELRDGVYLLTAEEWAAECDRRVEKP